MSASSLSALGLRPLTGEIDAAARHRWVYATVTALAVTAWGAHALHGGPPVFPVDDAYITLNNARALVTGHDPHFPGGSALCGATSAIHLALVSVLLRLLPPLWALDVSLGVAFLAYTLGLARLALVHRASPVQAVLFVLLGTVIARVPYHLLNGLETGLAMAGVVWALALASDPSPARRRWLPVLCGQLPFLRPELVVVSLLLLTFSIEERWRSCRDARETTRHAVGELGMAMASAMPWLAWYWVSTGVPYPTTIAAKRLFFAEAGLPPEVKRLWVVNNLLAFAATIGLFSGALFLLPSTRLGQIGLVFGAALAGAYYSQFPGALHHGQQRYLYVLLPFLLYGAAACLGHRLRPLRIAAALLLALGLVQSLAGFSTRWWEYQNDCRFTTAELEPAASWCRGHLPADAVVLIHDAGYLSFATPFHLVDLVGLKTPDSIAEHRRFTFPSGGRDRALAIDRIARRHHPGYLVVLRQWDGIFQITPGLQRLGWRLALLRPEGQYQVYRLQPPVPLREDAVTRADSGSARRWATR